MHILQEAAIENKIYLCTGSIAEKKGDRITNTSYLISPAGKNLLKYSKCHLFDVNFKKLKIRESNVFSAGNDIKSVATPFGRIGILICYDIRFPEMARKLALSGTEIILVPAAFNNITGHAHWHIFFRTRAAENQVFLACASPATNNSSEYKAYGHSMIIDPFGSILSEAGTGESIIYSILDPKVLSDTRKKLPLLKHRRKDLYE